VTGLRTYLKKKFGSIIAGWRALDQDCNGRLTFYEFCNACRKMGYHGNLRQLWRDLDVDLNGYITLAELDKEAGLLMGSFKLRLLQEYGDMLTAWEKGIDRNGSGRIEEAELKACCQKLGFDCDTKKLYRMLRSSPSTSTHGLTLQMFDADAHRRKVSGDLKGHLSGANKEFLEDLPGMGEEIPYPEDVASHKPGGAVALRNEQKAKEREHVGRVTEESYKLKRALHTAEGFKRVLIARCGSLLGAWREALDLDGNGRLTFGEFCMALERLGFYGDVKGLWKLLDAAGKGYLLFGDLDQKAADSLSSFYDKMREAHGNLLLAWVKELDKKQMGYVDEHGFVAACKRVGFEGDACRLFKLMKPEAGRRLLTLKDFDTKAYLAFGRGDFRMLSEGEGTRKKQDGESCLDLSFEDRQQSAFFHQIRSAWAVAQREEFAKTTGMVPEFVIDTPEEFQMRCVRRYGSVIAAWRQCLDADGNGRLTFNEFCGACRRLGYEGNLMALWTEYGGQEKGFISLKELDPTADELVTTFLQLLGDRFGTIDEAWKSGFGKDPHESIDEPALDKMCRNLGYSHSSHKLFKYLQPFRGGICLTIWDIDPECTRKRQRGDEATFDTPSSPKHGTSTSSSQQSRGAGASSSSSSSAALATRLRTALKNKYGSSVAAWRSLGSGKVLNEIGFTDFCRLLQGCEFSGSAKKLWKDLVCEREAKREKDGAAEEPVEETVTVTLAELDPEAQAILDKARKALVGRFGTLLVAWSALCKSDLDSHEKKLDEAGRRGSSSTWKLDSAAFAASCGRLNVALKNPSKAFRLMLGDPCQGQRSLIKSDLCALLIGVPAENRAEVMGQARAEEPDLDPKAYMKKAAHEFHSQNIQAASIVEVKKALAYRCGSLYSAWRTVLDQDNNGVVSQAEFQNILRELGYKAVQSIWAELVAGPAKTDSNAAEAENGQGATEAESSQGQGGTEAEGGRSGESSKDVRELAGQISFSDFDLETCEMFGSWEESIIEKYGSTLEGWRKCFEQPEPRGPWVEESKFIRQCRELGWSGNARKLFKLVRPEPGRKYLTYEDLWRNMNKNASTAHVPIEPNRRREKPKQSAFEDAHPMLDALRSFLEGERGGAEEGWKRCFEDPEPRGPRVDETKFLIQCGKLGVKGDGKDFFRKLQAATGRKYMVLKDVCPPPAQDDSNATGGASPTSAAAS